MVPDVKVLRRWDEEQYSTTFIDELEKTDCLCSVEFGPFQNELRLNEPKVLIPGSVPRERGFLVFPSTEGFSAADLAMDKNVQLWGGQYHSVDGDCGRIVWSKEGTVMRPIGIHAGHCSAGFNYFFPIPSDFRLRGQALRTT
jgi:hypothetical protein